ncbi:DNA polymerase III subunit gamma/tau [Aporhodopirellula aestuarii]|uniref:DNA polymerase III subunit gamma/tau n=1 Tax=Aporhodopirellula aestuarii TaxID=2950107 RepID=A0ABT0U118_9BACT|nr:DNA polymerase III subunit gamma/tau [Aporhodopirellula aestuarii]MCM2370597.1 DNA polymerase III subunit gamma/tau [Aporhodopirellula aestuarii]
MGNSAREQDSENGSYVVVARRYRPRDFDQLVGQDHVAKALQGAIETSRVGHAYLFTGARGVGKTSTARIFAKALNHPGGPTAHPDSESDIAQAIDSGEDVDVIEIDGASNRGIDEIRSLRANVGVRPSRSRYKIYIIDEVHMLTGAAFNALLKTLEEPPEHVKFIFCTTDPEKIPITVLSRCQRFDFAPVESSKIVGRLREIVEAESNTADEEALELLARRAAGSMRDSQSLLEQVLSFSDGHLTADQVHAMLGTADDQRLHRLAQAMQARDAAAAIAQVDEAVAAGVDAGRLTEQMLGYFRDLMAVSVGCDASMMRYAAGSMHESLVELGRSWGLQTVLAIVGLVDETLVRIRHSVHARVLLESTLIQICHLPDLQAIVDLTSAAKEAGAGSGEKKNIVSRAVARPVAAAPVGSAPATVTAAPSANAADAPASPAPPVSPTPVASAVDASAGHEVNGNAASHATPSPASASPAVTPPAAPVAAPAAQQTASTAVAEPVAGSKPPITDAELQSVWPQILDEMDPITATLVKAAERVAVPSPGVVELTFPETSGLAMSRCGSPTNKDEIVRTATRVTGRQVSLAFATGTKAPVVAQAVAKPKTKNRMQRMREIESNPMVRACVELLGAEIVRIDTPRN